MFFNNLMLFVPFFSIKEFPPQLREFPNVLRTLDLSENHFVTLPGELIGKFTLLKHLNVS